MLSIQFLRDNIDAAKQNMQKKGMEDKLNLIDQALDIDKNLREVMQQEQALRAQRNTVSKQIAEAKKQGQDPQDLFNQAKDIPNQIKALEEQLKQKQDELKSILMQLPNIMHESVPQGKDDSENKETQRHGEPQQKNFEIKNHAQLTEELGLADYDASARVAGNGFYYLIGDLALLDLALQQYAVQFMVQRGYTMVVPPFMLNQKALSGVTDVADRENMIYKIQDQDLYLIGTSEHSLIAMFMDKQIDHTKLPIKLCGISPCFRQEIGSHGLDEKGVFRTHQFYKVEQIVLCHPNDSWQFYDEMLNNSVELFKSLEVPVRVLDICTGDLGHMKAKQADVEVWSPRQQKYFEVCSCSNLTDNQAMLLNIRTKHHDGNFYPHTLNDTAIATSRAMVAILENHQQEDGSISIPKVLQPFMQGKTHLEPQQKLYE